MKFNQVTENVTLLKIPQGSNIACIALPDELIFVDTGLNTIVATDFRKEMEGKYKRKGSTLLLTHAHIDHFLGMNAFSDCKIVAAETAKPKFEKFVNIQLTDEVLENMSKIFPSIKSAATVAKISMPNIWVGEKKYFGKNKEIKFYVLGGHSNCSSAIFYEPEKILFTGDLIQAGVYPYFGESDTDMNKWIEALKKWEKEEIDYILPGHGGVLEKNYISSVRSFFEEILEKLKQFKKEGFSEEEVLKQEIFDKGYWPKNAQRKPSYDFSIRRLYSNL